MFLLRSVSSTGVTSTGEWVLRSQYVSPLSVAHMRVRSGPNCVMLRNWIFVDCLFSSLLTKSYRTHHHNKQTHITVHMNHHSHHQHIMLQRFNMLTVHRIAQVPFLTVCPHIINNYIFHNKTITSRYFCTEQKGCCNKNIVTSLLKIAYSLNDLASCDTVLSPCYFV